MAWKLYKDEDYDKNGNYVGGTKDSQDRDNYRIDSEISSIENVIEHNPDSNRNDLRRTEIENLRLAKEDDPKTIHEK